MEEITREEILDVIGAPEDFTPQPWHVDWKQIEEDTWEGIVPMSGLKMQRTYDPLLDIWKYSYANGHGGWSLFACIREC